MKEDRPYLEHILQSINKVQSYTLEGKEYFLQDTKTHDAVIRNFEIIGEAVKQLSDSVKAKQL